MLRAVVLLWTILMVSTLSSMAALAAPPKEGSEDFDQLMPFADWISGRAANNGGLCCSISDCRVVNWRARGDGYEAFIAKFDDRGFLKFPGAPNAWIGVPLEVIKRESNPTGRAIACWSANYPNGSGFYCFFLPDLT